jgi:hypothetical protein
MNFAGGRFFYFAERNITGIGPVKGIQLKLKKTGGTRQLFLVYTRHESSSSCLGCKPPGSFVRPPAKSKVLIADG